jgi:hypothetical protein
VPAGLCTGRKALNGSDLMLDKLAQTSSARRLPFLPEPPLAPVPAPAPASAPARPQDRRRPQRQRSRPLRWSLALLVLLPTALGSIYFAPAHAVLSSPQEVWRIADLLRSHRAALRSVHDMPQECDPTKQAEARYSLLGKLEEALAQAKTKLANLRWFMGEDDPNELMLNSKIASLQRQVAEERAKLGEDEATATRGRQSLGGLVANDEERLVGREFAEKAYVSAPASLKRAPLKADRQQPYVVASINVFAIPLLLWTPGVFIADGIGD